MMSSRLTPRQEKFCAEYLKTGYIARAMRAAGYAGQWPTTAGNRVLRLPAVTARMNELRQLAEDEAVMKIVERKRKLTEIARGRITDYLDDNGTTFVVNKESVNPGAVAEVVVRNRQGRDGESGEAIADLRLHDPIRAIDMLNKMEGLYTDREHVSVPIANMVEVVMVRPRESPDSDR
jgi:phage terminase small subunit